MTLKRIQYGVFWVLICGFFIGLTAPGCSAPPGRETTGVTWEPKPAPLPQPRPADVTSDTAEKTVESRMDNYFVKAYEDIEFNDLEPDEQELFRDEEFFKSDFKEFIDDVGTFMRKKLPYVNLSRPRPKDFAFLIRYGDAIFCYKTYSEIDMVVLSQQEFNAVKAFGERNPSRKIDRTAFPGLEPSALETLLLFVDLRNLSDRDIVFLQRLGVQIKTNPAESSDVIKSRLSIEE